MRFSCLPGAYGKRGSPIVKELTEDSTTIFHFIEGPRKAVPPKQFEYYFGNPPYFRFIEPDDVGRSNGDEHELMKEGVAATHRSTDAALKFLLKIMKEKGPLRRRFQKQGIAPMFKYAISFAGWPHVDLATHAMILSDETDEIIEIPTCYIIGSLDPYLRGSMALYNVCDADTAYLFDHAKGHTLPRDKDIVKEPGDVVRKAIENYNIGE